MSDTIKPHVLDVARKLVYAAVGQLIILGLTEEQAVAELDKALTAKGGE